MSNNQNSGGTDNPEECAYWRGNPEEWDTDHEEGDVEALLGDNVVADLSWLRCWRFGRCLSRGSGGIDD